MTKMIRNMEVLTVIGMILLLLGCEGQWEADPTDIADTLSLSATVEKTARCSASDYVFEFEYSIPVSEDASLHLLEKFTVKSLFSRDRKAVLMLPPTLTSNIFYDADIDDLGSYNVLKRMAKAGYFAFAVSYEGYGESSMPSDGRTVTFERTLSEIGFLVEVIRIARFTDKVDLIGGSMGAALAVALGSDGGPIPYAHIGRIVLTSMPYRNFSPFVEEEVFTPEFEEYLQSLSYIETGPEMYAPVAALATPEAAVWINTNFPGVYATGPTLEGFDLPMWPAELGRVPALQIYGELDIIHTMEDVAAFQSEYGGSVSLMVVEGGGHSPFFEAGRDDVFETIISFFKGE